MCEKQSKGRLVVISGPSGVGKGTVLKEVQKSPDYVYSVSATTRPPREGEVDGVNYFFMTRPEFEALIKEGGFLEYAEYNGNFYGTPKKFVEESVENCLNVILEIEVKGAMQIKRMFPNSVFVFIAPDSVKELERRLRDRATEAEEIILKRLQIAKRELASCLMYDYIIINRCGRHKEAAADILSAVRASKLRPAEVYPEITDFFLD